MEDFMEELHTLKRRRAVLLEGLEKSEGELHRSLQNEIRDVDAKIAVLEDAIERGE